MPNKSDNIMEIFCPACGKKMKKIYMPEQCINIDVCTEGCGGIFFDNREFKEFDEQHEDISKIEELLKNKKFKKVDTSENRICPNCGQKMVKNFASAKHEIEVDECYACGGKFLDHTELERIRAQYETEEERAQDVLREFNKTYANEIQAHKDKYNKAVKETIQHVKLMQSLHPFGLLHYLAYKVYYKPLLDSYYKKLDDDLTK